MVKFGNWKNWAFIYGLGPSLATVTWAEAKSPGFQLENPCLGPYDVMVNTVKAL